MLAHEPALQQIIAMSAGVLLVCLVYAACLSGKHMSLLLVSQKVH